MLISLLDFHLYCDCDLIGIFHPTLRRFAASTLRAQVSSDGCLMNGLRRWLL